MFSAKKVVAIEQPFFTEKKDDGFGDKGKNDAKKVAELRKGLSELLDKADGSFCLVFFADSDKNYLGIGNLETVDCNRLDNPA